MRTPWYRETVTCLSCNISVTAGTPGNAVRFWNERAGRHALDVDRAAKSLADMVTEWVDGGIAMNTDWRNGLYSVIKKRLGRFAKPALAEPVAFMTHDQMRAITEKELSVIPNEEGRRDRCANIYPVPLYPAPARACHDCDGLPGSCHMNCGPRVGA